MSADEYAPYVEAEQDNAEFAQLLSVVSSMHPASILEVGVFMGGSLRWWMNEFPDVVVVGIDPRPIIAYDNVIIGCSQDRAVRQRAESLNNGERFDFVFIDGDHSYEGVKEDWEWACREARKGVAFHDIHSIDSCPGVVKFWHELIQDVTVSYAEITRSPDRNGIGVVFLSGAT